MGPALFFVLALIGVGVAAYVSYYLKQKRRQELALAATQLGLSFSQDDPFGTVSEPFDLLRKGDGRRVENVMWGTWSGMECREFDYWYYDETTDSQGHRSKSYHRFSCVLASVGAACSPLLIDHENLLTRIGDHIGLRDIEFESEEFNAAFTVKGPDRKFANDLIDARMMRWLLDHADGYRFEAMGGQILASTRKLAPLELTPLLGTTRDFVAQIPKVVYSLYPMA